MRGLLKIALLLLALSGLAGCGGTRLAYNNADTALSWMADDYFALEGAQRQDFKARLARFHSWHRSEELPRYSALMAGAAAKLADGLTQPDLQWAWDGVLARYRRMAQRAAPELAAVLVTLTPAQFEHLEQKFAKSDAAYRKKYLDADETGQRQRRDQRNLELMREWFGELSDEQEAQLMRASARLPLLYALRLQNRQRRQQEFVALLKAYRSPAELEPRLRHWLAAWEEGAAPEYQRLSQLHRERYMQLLLQLDASLKPTQRAHAAARLAEYGEVFAALAQQNALARLSAD